jgi:hypothetical protein
MTRILIVKDSQAQALLLKSRPRRCDAVPSVTSRSGRLQNDLLRNPKFRVHTRVQSRLTVADVEERLARVDAVAVFASSVRSFTRATALEKTC